MLSSGGCDSVLVQRHKLGFSLGQALRFIRVFSGGSALGRPTQACRGLRLYRSCWVSAHASIAGPYRRRGLKIICRSHRGIWQALRLPSWGETLRRFN